MPDQGPVVAKRGSGNLITVQNNEAYNNTCYAPSSKPGQQCIAFDTSGGAAAATANSIARNNLFYVPAAATGPAVHSTGSGNTVSNNTTTVTANPGFMNGSGNYSVITDFKPTANYSGGMACRCGTTLSACPGLPPGISAPCTTSQICTPRRSQKHRRRKRAARIRRQTAEYHLRRPLMARVTLLAIIQLQQVLQGYLSMRVEFA